MDTDSASLPRRDGSEALDLCRVAHSAEGHRPREIRYIIQARSDPTLQISSHKQRQLGVRLQLVGDSGYIRGGNTKQTLPVNVRGQDDRSDMVFLQLISETFVVCTFQARVVGITAHLEHLADLFFERESVQRLINPFLILLGQWWRS